MKIEPTTLLGVATVSIEALPDERGFFARTYDAAQFAAAGLPTNWPHCNVSWNERRGTLRGMHFQRGWPEPKLIRCTRGRVFDVAVDLRPESPTYCQWVGVELTHAERNALYIPSGCAHGFLTLEDDCELLYMMGEIYLPEFAAGVRWNDPTFGIRWPFDPVIMSAKDEAWPDFAT